MILGFGFNLLPLFITYQAFFYSVSETLVAISLHQSVLVASLSHQLEDFQPALAFSYPLKLGCPAHLSPNNEFYERIEIVSFSTNKISSTNLAR